MHKHAYLIQAHNDFYILERLIKLIDYKDNDIYIHIDKKVKKFDFDYYKNLAQKSNIYFTKRIDVRWGTYDQIKSELILFETASHKHYDYYHLISGVDLIIKSQKEIHNFFKQNQGKEFIAFDQHNKVFESSLDRITYYHFFTKHLRYGNKTIKKIFNSLHYRIFNFQKKLNIKRKISFEVRKGANWVSITDNLVGYILKNKKFIKKYFKYSYCADELFIPTLVYNSDFYDKLYAKNNDNFSDCKRYIDWNRGMPFTFTSEDYEAIINSDDFFARKFSSEKDKNVIDKIYNKVKGDQNAES